MFGKEAKFIPCLMTEYRKDVWLQLLEQVSYYETSMQKIKMDDEGRIYRYDIEIKLFHYSRLGKHLDVILNMFFHVNRNVKDQ